VFAALERGQRHGPHRLAVRAIMDPEHLIIGQERDVPGGRGLAVP
jgi:hypothetical protein